MKNLSKLSVQLVTLLVLQVVFVNQISAQLIDVDVNEGGGELWYQNPYVVVIGVLVVLLVAVLAMRKK